MHTVNMEQLRITPLIKGIHPADHLLDPELLSLISNVISLWALKQYV